MKRHVTAVGVCLLLAALGACSQGDPREYAKQQSKASAKPKSESTIVAVTTPVAPGAKVHCEDWIDLAIFKEKLAEQKDLGLKDLSTQEHEPTSICSVTKGGEAPSAAEQAKVFDKEGMKIGTVGGDEICLAHLMCGVVATVENVRKKCDADPMSDMSAVGDEPACVRRTQRAAKWAYKMTVIDPDTQCALEVQGGPSVTDEQLVRTCAESALLSLTKEGIGKPFLAHK
jgi:hypothetical protein